MSFRHPLPVFAALATVGVLLAGCGHVAGSQVPAQLPAATKVSTVAVAAIAPVDAALAVNLAGNSTLALQVSGLAGFHVQATSGQVQRLKITLANGPLTTPVVKEVTLAHLASSAGLVTFEGLPSGTVDVTIEAEDASGKSLGRQQTSAAIVKGETTVLAASLKLDPTHLTNPNGDLSIEIKLEDGDLIVDPIAHASGTVAPTPAPLPVADAPFQETWFVDGTVSVMGTVSNTSGAARHAKVTVTFQAPRLIWPGFKTVETQTVDLGTLAAGAVKHYAVTSAHGVSSLRGEGRAQVAVQLQ